MRERMSAVAVLVALAVLLHVGCRRASEEATPPAGEPHLEDAAAGFVHALVKEDYANAVRDFDDTMKKAMPAEKLEEAWRSLIAQAGAFQKQLGIHQQSVGPYEAVFVTCKFERATLDVKVVLDKAGRITGLWFVPPKVSYEYKPPAYVKKDFFQEEDVQVGAGKWMLPGTLTLPKGQGPFPAVVLVHGSGPHDRDETIGPNKPFRDLAWGLASRGIAVLRYEKRTKYHPKELARMKEGITVKEETIDDALAAVKLLRQRDDITPAKIFVLGHSLGGMLVPRIGMRDKDIAGFILLAATTRPTEDVILEQMAYIFGLDGKLSEDEKKQLAKMREQVARVKDPKLSPETPSSDLPFGVPAAYWLDLRGYKPQETAQSLKHPMLILQGGRDYQVTTTDFEGWKKSLSSRKNVTFKLYPELNHLFVAGKGKSTPAEYLTAGHVAEIVIKDIANWIKKQ